MPVSNVAWSPAFLTATSTSRFAFSTISSIRVGWIRPSDISFSRAILATSRRMGSKLETVIASGVSSIIRSTPVSVSMVLMLRPSRPMIRPFISSLGRATDETVISATWSAAQRCIARATMFLAFSSASSLKSCSSSTIFLACSCLTSSTMSSMSFSLACSAVIPEMRCKASLAWVFNPSSSWEAASFSWILPARISSFFSRASVLRSRVSSFDCALRSWRVSSLRRSLISCSNSFLALSISSLASIRTSFFAAAASVFAWFMLSAIIFFAWSSAEPIVDSATFFR